MIFLVHTDMRAVQCSEFSIPWSLSSWYVTFQGLLWTLSSSTWWYMRLSKSWVTLRKYCRPSLPRRFPLSTPGWWTCHTSCWPWQQPVRFSFWLLKWVLYIGKTAQSPQKSFQNVNFRAARIGCVKRMFMLTRDSRRVRDPSTLPGELDRFRFFLFSCRFKYLSFRLETVSTWEFNSIFTKISGGCQVSSVYFQSMREFPRRLPPSSVVSPGRAGDKPRGRFSSSSQCSHYAFINDNNKIIFCEIICYKTCTADLSPGDYKACHSPREAAEMASWGDRRLDWQHSYKYWVRVTS